MKSLSQSIKEVQAQIDAVKIAPPNPPDIAALWVAVHALEARVTALEDKKGK